MALDAASAPATSAVAQSASQSASQSAFQSAAQAGASAKPAGPPLATPAQRAKVQASAQAFEAQLLSLMMKPMFEGLNTSGPFGGGMGEETFRGFLLDAIGKQVAKAGGVGLAAPVAREMLRMQGLQ